MNIQTFKRLHVEFLRKTKEPPMHRRWFEKILPERTRNRWFMSVLPQIDGLKILDLCGGYGQYGAYLQAVAGLSFGYTCLEKEKHRVEQGPEYFKTFGLEEPSFTNSNVNRPLPLQDDSFDMVWLFGWCNGKKNCNKLFKDVSRVLKPKGYFMFNMARKSVTKYKTRYTRKGLLNLLEKTGFTVIRLDLIPNKVDFGVVAREGTDHLLI